VLDRDLVDRWIKTNDRDVVPHGAPADPQEGLLCGGSCGSAVVGAMEVAKDMPKGAGS
jgi:cystathionine beta-synthase